MVRNRLEGPGDYKAVILLCRYCIFRPLSVLWYSDNLAKVSTFCQLQGNVATFSFLDKQNSCQGGFENDPMGGRRINSFV